MTPSVRCEARGLTFCNIHSSIRQVFGNVEVVRTGGERSVIIHEDTRGWNGTSPLVFSLYMASGILMLDPKTTEICFGVRQSTSIIMILGGLLGRLFNIYSRRLQTQKMFLLCVIIQTIQDLSRTRQL
jgi:hypothetical protein